MPNYTGAVARQLGQKLGENISVLDFGGVGDGVHDDTSAIVAALSAAAGRYSSRVVYFPLPKTSAGYLVTSTITIPCDNILLKGSGRKAKIVSNVTAAPLFDTDGHSYVTFDDLFLAGQVDGADQVGIYVNGLGATTTGVQIINCFIGQFGVKPPGTLSGSCVKVRGDNLSLVIARNTCEVWGDGIDIDGTVDLLRVYDNQFGVGAAGNDSGWGLKLKNSAGSGQNVIEHNNFTTPGGGAKIGPTAGLIHFKNNQYEALIGGHDVSNNTGSGNSTAHWFDSAIGYIIRDNNIELHDKGDYGYFCTNFSNDAIFENNKCGGARLAQWVFPGVDAVLGFKNNTDFSGEPNYNYPYYPGIQHTSHKNGYRGWGTQYPAAPFHIHLRDAPFWHQTTLSGDIADNATTLTLASGSEIAVGTILYIDAEQIVVTDAAASPTFTVARAHNGTTATAHSNGAAVSTGPVGALLVTSSRSGQGAHSLALGFDTGMGYLKCRTRVGNVFYAIPVRVDQLTVQNSDPSLNTLAIIKGVNGQSDYPWQYKDYNGNRKASLSSTGGVFELEGNALVEFRTTSTGGIALYFGAVDANSAGLLGTFSNHPVVLYANSAIVAKIMPDGGFLLNPVTLPASPVEGYLAMDSTAHKLKYYNGSAWVSVEGLADQSGHSGQFLKTNGTAADWAAIAAGDFTAQNANKVLAGPSTGADAVPTFRALVQADVPAMFTDRGDPASPDKTSWTTGSWTDWDLSSIVPAGATIVLLHVQMIANASANDMNVRKNGNSNTANAASLKVPANGEVRGDLIVACDANRVIEYYIPTTFTALSAVVGGWGK